MAVGPRGHFKLGEKVWLRPCVAFAVGLDDPMKASKHKILQIDVPFAFVVLPILIRPSVQA